MKSGSADGNTGVGGGRAGGYMSVFKISSLSICVNSCTACSIGRPIG